jgi:hypothetical protein
MEITAFDRATAQDITSAPFPHLVIQNALPPDLYQALRACRPDPFYGIPPKANMRLPIPAHLLMEMAHIPPLWKEFAAALTTPEITRRVATLFAAHLHPDQPLRALVSNPDQSRAFGLVHRDCPMDHPLRNDAVALQTSATIYSEARLEVISPSGETDGGSHRRAHLDSRNRLFTALLYFRHPDDDSNGGGLDLFRWRKPPTTAQMDAFELNDDSVERALTLPYQGNTLALFPQSPDALHGMAPRGPSAHQRAYIFISAQVPEAWFAGQGNGKAKGQQALLP